MNDWKVKINGKGEKEVREEKGALLIDGNSPEIDLLKIDDNKFHLIHEGRSYNASLLNIDSETKMITLKINNRKYELQIEDQYDQLLQKLGMDNLATAAISQLKAPMPGLVLEVMAKEGDTVAKNDSLLILEAMKMENVLKSPADLTIKKVTVQEKQSVEKNQVLIEFE